MENIHYEVISMNEYFEFALIIIAAIVIAALSGIISGLLISKHYRNKDNQRDKRMYMIRLRNHVSILGNITNTIELKQGNNYELIEELKRELYWCEPIFENRFALTEQEKNVIYEYKDELNIIKKYIKEFEKCKNNLSIMDSMNGDVFFTIKSQQENYINKIGTSCLKWLAIQIKI